MSDVLVHRFVSHVDGPHPPFIGEPATCGYRREGDIWLDQRGDVGELRSEPLDVARADHRALLVATYLPDEAIRPDQVDEFRECLRTMGLNHYQVAEVVEALPIHSVVRTTPHGRSVIADGLTADEARDIADYHTAGPDGIAVGSRWAEYTVDPS